MLFSSSVFLFLFLPVVLLCYYVPLRRFRLGQNIFLLLASLIFYAWGEPKFVLVMMASIFFNYLFGLWADACRRRGRGMALAMFVTVAANLSLFFVFKYLNFTVENLNALGLNLTVPGIRLPIGISFFTFQALSYVIDVARGKGKAQTNLLNVGLYIAFFPQLIAGPIVKYETVAEEIQHRRESWDDFSAGVCRFIVGLGKKVIISNQLAILVDHAFDRGVDSVAFAWLGALCFILQIFYDFSGYSDMAIGLGRMFGFHFLENFNYPFTATSITDLWRRWHISLTTWFKDYVFISLGGSRVKSRARLLLNYFLVWLLTGIWHGANWTFVLWGLMNFGLLMWEKYGGLGRGWPKFWGWFYTFWSFVVTSMVFRANSLSDAWQYGRTMFHLGDFAWWSPTAGLYLREFWFVLLLAVLAAMPSATWLRRQAQTRWGGRLAPAWEALSVLGLAAVFLLSVCFIVKGTYNPFIYFNF